METETNHKLKRFSSVTELIGNQACPTPLVRLNGIVSSKDFSVWLKLEWLNPFGSIKDRTAKFLLEGLFERGDLEGKEVVEPTSGNTGIALTALGNLMGIKTTITIPDGVPEEKKTLLRLLGAKVWPTPDNLCPVDHPRDGAIALARAIALDRATGHKYVMPNQYENPDNVLAHYQTTGPEIWKQTEGRIRHFFAGYGTCGTICGVGRFLKERDPSIRVVAVEPQRGHRLPGLKNFEESKKPSILDESVVDDVIRVNDEEAYDMTLRIIRQEGLLVGPSTGAIVHAASKFAPTGQGVAVALSPDSVFKYVTYMTEYVGDDRRPELSADPPDDSHQGEQ